MRPLSFGPTVAAAIFLVGQPAAAQIVQANGAPIAGLCIYSENGLLGRSQAGIAANRQLAAFQQSVNADLSVQRDRLVADDRALTAQKAQLPAASFEQRQADLRRRAEDLQNLSRTRDDQLSRTRADAIAQVSKAALPLFNAALTAHHCAVVFDATPVYSVNPLMDLTGEVIERLNASLPNITLQLAPPRA